MPTYTMTGPDGKTYSIDGPPGATQQQVQQQMQAHAQQMQGQQPAAPTAPPKPAGGDLGGSLYAGVHGFEDMATFGQGDKVAALASSLTEQVGHMAGLDTAGITKAPQSYGQNLQDIQGGAQQEAQAHPIANTTGEVAGLLPGGELLGRAAQTVGRYVPGAARAMKFLEPVANSPVSNVAKSAVVNAAVGGGMALANGQSAPQAAQTAGISAVLGPTVGKAASFALEKLAPAAQKAYMLLADKFDMKPQELQTAIQNYQQVSNGAMPTVAGLANLKAQGRLADLAKPNATIAERAMQAANPALQTPAQQGILKIATGGGPQTAADLFDLRKANMDASMDQVRTTPFPYTQRGAAMLSDPLVSHALRDDARTLGDTGLYSKVQNYIADGPAGSHLTIDDIDSIREALRNRQDVYANPQSASHSRPIAKEFGDVANKVEQFGRNVEPGYGTALDQYRKDSDYLTGFQHGQSGKGIGEAQPGSQTAIALQRAPGQQGYAHGRQLAASDAATGAIAPSSVTPQTQFSAHNAGQAAMAVASPAGGVGMIYHIMRSVPGLHLSEPVQQKISAMLFDPRSTPQAVAVLQRAGVDAQSIRRMGAAAGGLASQRVAGYLSKGQ